MRRGFLSGFERSRAPGSDRIGEASPEEALEEEEDADMSVSLGNAGISRAVSRS